MLNNMVLKTFNVSKETYEEFSAYCKEMGLSMSKQVDVFMKSQLALEPKARQEYLNKLERVRKGKFVRVEGSLTDRYV